MANRVFIGHDLGTASDNGVPRRYRLEEVPRERIVECTVTDAIGLEDDTCTLMLEQGTLNRGTRVDGSPIHGLPATASIIVVVADVPGSNRQVLFPPYDIDTLEYDGEDGAMVLTAKVNLYFFINFLDLAPRLVSRLQALQREEPFNKWSGNTNWADTIVAQIVEDTSFAGIKSTLKSRGILMKQTAVPSIGADGSFYVDRDVVVEAYYPNQVGEQREYYSPVFNDMGVMTSVVTSRTPTLRPLPPNDTRLVVPRFPSTFNRAGDYLDRRLIIGNEQPSITAPGGISTNVVETGTKEPRIYLPLQQNLFDVWQSFDAKRWQLQQEACETNVTIGLDPTFVPRSLVSIDAARIAGNDLSVDEATNWWVKKATHRIFPDNWTTELELGWAQDTRERAFPALESDETFFNIVTGLGRVVDKLGQLEYFAPFTIGSLTQAARDAQPPVTGVRLTMGPGTPGEYTRDLEHESSNARIRESLGIAIPANVPFRWYRAAPLTPAGTYAGDSVVEVMSPGHLVPAMPTPSVTYSTEAFGRVVLLSFNFEDLTVNTLDAENTVTGQTEEYAWAVLARVFDSSGTLVTNSARVYHDRVIGTFPITFHVVRGTAHRNGVSIDFLDGDVTISRGITIDPKENATSKTSTLVTILPGPPGPYTIETRVVLIRARENEEFQVDNTTETGFDDFISRLLENVSSPVLLTNIDTTPG